MTVHLDPWSEDDLPVLEQTLGDHESMAYLGGQAESPEQLAERNVSYVGLPGAGIGEMFTIVDDESGRKVGSIGFWHRPWRGAEVYETGWHVVRGMQGRGIATAAAAQVIERLRADGVHRYLHAFPSVENAASNAICRKLGFTLLEAIEHEYPKGKLMRCNDWQLDLQA